MLNAFDSNNLTGSVTVYMNLTAENNDKQD